MRGEPGRVPSGRTLGPQANDLLGAFREFYTEVLRLRAEIAAATDPVTPLTDSTMPSLAPDVEIVARQLQGLLSRQLARGVDPEACYAMAALADDIFLHETHWVGHSFWRDMMLEYRLFQSHIAGEEIFARIEQLLQNRRVAQIPMAQIYLLLLQQGFRGGLRSNADNQKLQEYAVALFNFVYRREPDPLREDAKLFAQAAAHTLTGPPMAPQRFGGRGAWISAAAAVLLLLASQLAWLSAASGIALAAGSVP